MRTSSMLETFFLVCAVCCLIASARARADAGSHFDAGVRAFEQQRFADAAVEFERAYATNPAFQVLYNLGTVYAALGRPVESVRAFERYLTEADASVDESRREQVRSELEEQRAKIGWLDVQVAEPGAEIRVDAKLIGTSPLAGQIPLAVGAHTLELTQAGRESQRRELSIARGQRLVVTARLTPVAPAVAPVPARAPSPEVAQPTAAAERSTPGQTQRVIGWCLGGAGLVGGIVSGVLIADGHLQHLDAVDLAERGQRSEAESLEAGAERTKTHGFVTLGVAGAVFVAGAVLLLSAPDRAHANARTTVLAWASESSGGVVIGRTW